MEHFVWNVDPVLLSLGGLKIHWYGALFAAAILSGLQLMKWLYQQEKQPVESLDNLLTYAVFGIIVGARLGHCFFYDPQYYLANPLKILAIWEGGLASHGGGLGLIAAVYYYAKKYQMPFLWLLDRLAIATALFGIFVRCANFINSEILGQPSNGPWAVIFARIDNVPRHPAQLYEAIAYLVIFVILVSLYKTTKAKLHNGRLLGVFLMLTFSARFLIEFAKQKQAAYNSDWVINTGQMLSIPFLIVGVLLLISSFKSQASSSNPRATNSHD